MERSLHVGFNSPVSVSRGSMHVTSFKVAHEIVGVIFSASVEVVSLEVQV